MTETILSLFSVYGAPVLFIAIAIGQFGIPVPTSILLMTAGAILGEGSFTYWQAFGWGLAGAVTGDHVGYVTGRLAGNALRQRLAHWPAIEAGIRTAELFSRRWGDSSVFFSRWLFSPVGPYINWTSGLSRHPLPRYSIAEISGETIWVGGYLLLGVVFAQSIAAVADIIANAAWMIAGAGVTAVLGWRLIRAIRRSTRKRHKPTS